MPRVKRIHRTSRHALVLVSLLLSALLAACGGGSADPNTLLRQTFSGNHTVRSGSLGFSLSVSPSGSSTITTPITLSFGGPFQSLGTGKLPKSNFNLSLAGLGRSGSIGILSTGTTGYVTLQGTSYQLPSATYQRLESSFAGVASSPAGSNGGTGLSRLGINPLHWLTDAQVVGHEHIGDADTTHIHAHVNVNAFLADFSTLLQKASSLGVTRAGALQNGIPASTRQRIASQVQNPTFDVWTGNDDKTLRRLALHLTLPVSGQASSALGGLKSAALGLEMQYIHLNQPQTITTPPKVRPFAEFQGKLQTLLASVQSAGAAAVGQSAGGSAGSSSSGAGSSSSGAGSGGTIQQYNACLRAAGQDVIKMQQCGTLLNGG